MIMEKLNVEEEFKVYEFTDYDACGIGGCGVMNEYYIYILAKSKEEASEILLREHPEYKGKEINWTEIPKKNFSFLTKKGKIESRVLTDALG